MQKIGEDTHTNTTAYAVVEKSGNGGVLRISGSWVFAEKRTSSAEIGEMLNGITHLSVDCGKILDYDTSLSAFLLACAEICAKKQIEFDISALPNSLKKLVGLAVSSPKASEEKKLRKEKNILRHIGNHTTDTILNIKEQVEFLGEVAICLAKMLKGRIGFSKDDFMLIIQRAGAEALPIVALISFLVGLILAFVGGVQLSKYGSEIFVADLVGLAMVREMGVIMVGIVMAGRTGAAFAAELGTMKVNEEISAFQTFGISPMEYLVMPRMIALVLMFPLLTIFADFIGILGGALIGFGLFDLNAVQYLNRTATALDLTQCLTGVGKSFIFGIIVAVVGCMRGMKCGNSSSAVGLCTTASVVTSITFIIVADAIFAVLFNIFDI